MKTNLYKVLSLILSVSLLMSVCFISASLSVSAAEKITDYYVGYGGTGDGSSLSKMAPSVDVAIKTMNANGLVAGDTANIWIVQDITEIKRTSETTATHNLAYYASSVKHSAKIVIKPLATNQASNSNIPTYLAMDSTVGSYKQLIIGGPTEIDGLCLVHCSNQYTFTSRFVITANGYDLTIGSGVTYGQFQYKSSNVSSWTGCTWDATNNAFSGLSEVHNFPISVIGNDGGETAAEAIVYENPMTLTLRKQNVSYAGYCFDLSGFNPGYATFKEDVTFVYDVSSYRPYAQLGCTKAGEYVITYEKNLNVKLPVATKIGFIAGARKVVVKGGLQLITNDNVLNGFNADDYPFSNFVANAYTDDTFTTNSDYWILETAEADTKNIDFINGETGKFEVAVNYIATATNVSTGATKDSENGVLDLSDAPGEYTVEFTYSKVEEETHNYDDLINYRGYNSNLTKFNGALANTYKKLEDAGEVNIVYMGGSVIKGDGSESSLREQIAAWFTNNYRNATISNIDKSIDNTGTTLGALRVSRDVVSKFPDLVFIEYSLDDYKQGVSAYKSKMQFETIVREIKSVYPDCDIVALFASTAEMGDELYDQAKAHEEICEKYKITSINIGSVQETYIDIVDEFLVNTLLFGEYGDSINITNQVLPENVNKYLFDGNVKFVFPSETVYTTNGGAIYDDDAQVFGVADYVGVVTMPENSKDTVTVTFNGTELYMLVNEGYSSENTYKISIDGGESFEVKSYSGNVLTNVISGLESGEHTVIIEPAVDAKIGVCGFYSRDIEKSTNELNICDLVYLNESLSEATIDYRDYNNDGGVNENDISALKKILIGDWMKPELNSTKHIKSIARLGWRPYTGNLPEQSLVSYQKAYDVGHRILLCDIRVTSDGYMVCCHDDDIAKVHAYDSNGTAVASGTVKISETALSDLLTYDFGKYRGYEGLEILQPEDFLKFCKELGDVTPVLEMKVDISDEQLAELTELIKKYGFEDSIMFVCTDQRFATALPNCTMGDWVYTLTDGVIARMDALTCKGKFVYVARDGGNEDSINFENYVKCKAKGIDLAITYIPSTYRDYYDNLKNQGIFNYCKYVALDEPNWLYE